MSALPLPDLSQCANEPIRIPGAIQPHGWMAIVGADGALAGYSANWADADRAAHAVRLVADRGGAIEAPGEGPTSLGSIELGEQVLDVLGHRTGDFLVLEFEPHSGSRSRATA